MNGRYLALSSFGEPRLPAPQPGKRYMLYAHVPFCQRLCPYCSFNRFPFSEERAVPYFESLRREMRMVADLGYDFGSMYVETTAQPGMLQDMCTPLLRPMGDSLLENSRTSGV